MSLSSFLHVSSLSSRLLMGISDILPGSKDTLLYHSTSFLCQKTCFIFVMACSVAWGRKGRWSHSYSSIVFQNSQNLLCSNQNFYVLCSCQLSWASFALLFKFHSSYCYTVNMRAWEWLSVSWLHGACLCTCTQNSTKLIPHGTWQNQNFVLLNFTCIWKDYSHWNVFSALGKKYAWLSGPKCFKISHKLSKRHYDLELFYVSENKVRGKMSLNYLYLKQSKDIKKVLFSK